MRKKGSKTKTKKEDTIDLEIPLKIIVKKLHDVCYPIEYINKIPVRFKYASQHEKNFTVHFKSESEEYVLTFSQDDIIIKTVEELVEMVLKDAKKKVKEEHHHE